MKRKKENDDKGEDRRGNEGSGARRVEVMECNWCAMGVNGCNVCYHNKDESWTVAAIINQP